MKTSKLKAFTLVEILIVVVIIGILIGALVPRMSAAQGRARDVARKNDLSQIQAAIIVSFQDKGGYPCYDKTADGQTNCTTNASEGLDVSSISGFLESAGLKGLPQDSIKSNKVVGLGDEGGAGEYRYMLVQSNSVANAGVVLMAKTETPGGSNYVYCGDDDKIISSENIQNITLCSSINKADECDSANCKYKNESDLRYVLLY